MDDGRSPGSRVEAPSSPSRCRKENLASSGVIEGGALRSQLRGQPRHEQPMFLAAAPCSLFIALPVRTGAANRHGDVSSANSATSIEIQPKAATTGPSSPRRLDCKRTQNTVLTRTGPTCPRPSSIKLDKFKYSRINGFTVFLHYFAPLTKSKGDEKFQF